MLSHLSDPSSVGFMCIACEECVTALRSNFFHHVSAILLFLHSRERSIHHDDGYSQHFYIS